MVLPVVKALKTPSGFSSFSYDFNICKYQVDLSSGGHRMSPKLGISLVGHRPWLKCHLF